MARSLNVIHLIGNLTRDPELRHTGSGRAVCAFGLATNRLWKTESGEVREESSYHRVVAWEKLAEQCAQLLVKGRRVYVQGRLGYRTYQKDDEEREVAEIVIDDMLLLDAKPASVPVPRGGAALDPQRTPAGGAPGAQGVPGGGHDTETALARDGKMPYRDQETGDNGEMVDMGQKTEPVSCSADEIADAIPF